MHSFILTLYLLPILVVCSAAPSIFTPLSLGGTVDLSRNVAKEQEIIDNTNGGVLMHNSSAVETSFAPTPRRMKIFMISVHPPHGGGSAHSSKELAVGLRREGHDVIHVAPYAKEDPKNPNEHYPGLLWMQANFPWDTLSISPEAQATMDNFIQQVYRSHGPFDAVILGRETMLWHLPAVRQVHGKAPIILIVRGAYINRLVSDEPIEPALKEQLFQLYRSADKIICIARHLIGSVVRGAGPQVVEKTIFLPNPIDLPLFQGASTSQPYLTNKHRLYPEHPIRLVMPAQIKARKRPLDAVEIVRILVERGLNVHLTSCGSGSDMQKMKDLIQRYRLENHITLMGHVKREEVMRVLNQSETVLLLSDNEGRPRSLQEAIAAGKGVVAYDNAGSHEVLNEWGHNFDAWPIGRLVPIGAIEQAANAVADLANYFRSDAHQPLLVSPLPSSLEVLHRWERMIEALL